jgi:hypothetical protein
LARQVVVVEQVVGRWLLLVAQLDGGGHILALFKPRGIHILKR